MDLDETIEQEAQDDEVEEQFACAIPESHRDTPDDEMIVIPLVSLDEALAILSAEE